MRFYDVMQLNAAQTKELLKKTEDLQEKRKYRCAFVVKNILCILFCMLVVISFSTVLGSENSIVGVVVLLSVLSMRQADLDIKAGQGAAVIIGIFAVLAAAPHAASICSPLPAAAINLAGFLLILILSCHNIYMFNHATFVLSYILLLGYDVSGELYFKRVAGLMAGALMISGIYYMKHRKKEFSCTFSQLFRDFLVWDERTRWQVKSAVGITAGMLIGSLLGLPRVMWIGFSCMSLLSPLGQTVVPRFRQRIMGVLAGCLLFVVLYSLLPGDPNAYIGIIGGIGVGFSGTYGWQTVFNCFGSLAMAVGTLGVPGAVFFRILHNAAGALYSLIFHKVYESGNTLLLKEDNGW